MKKLFESIKDFLYDSVDYLIMISIIGIVVFIIGWRINILFADKPLDEPLANLNEIEENSDNRDEMGNIDEKSNLATNDDLENSDLEEDVDISPNHEETTSPNIVETDISKNDNIIKITIPAGSLPSKIGTILESNGLVSSKADFISKSQEMNLDTKLKSGNYDIVVGTSLENIVKLIAK